MYQVSELLRVSDRKRVLFSVNKTKWIVGR